MARQSPVLENQLLQRLEEARRQSDALFRMVRAENLYDRPIAERHRIIFYIGHLEAFDWNLLRERILQAPSFHPEFDRLFAFGIDPVGGSSPSDQSSEWPSLDEIHSYRHRVRATLDRDLERALRGRSSEGNGEDTSEILLNVAIEHRLMHLETLAYMFHRLPFQAKYKVPASRHLDVPPARHEMAHIPAGRTQLGIQRVSGEFGWDNEFEAHEIAVPAFEIDRFMVTNRQYLEFIHAGGYETRAFWGDADWDWKTRDGIAHPAFWISKDNAWWWRSMSEAIPLPLDWPVYVSHAEASAYARWAGKTLPTEAEWHRAVYGDGQALYSSGDDRLGERVNADFRRWDPVPVNVPAAGASAFGVQGAIGNGWEWTATVFAPFAGFKPFPFYPGYSADFFDGRHFVMKGGSPRTAECMLRPSYRNWFQPHYPYVYAGFRCVSR